MAVIEVKINDDVLNESEEILGMIGMDVDMAINILLRRIIKEKRFPINMNVSISKENKEEMFKNERIEIGEESIYQKRNNNAITTEMVDEVWEAFIKYNQGIGEINTLRYEVSEKSGMNHGSAFIYLNILSNLVKGEPNTRTLKYKDLEYLMKKIHLELGYDVYKNSIKSLERSIPYWKEKLQGGFAEKVEIFCQKYSKGY